MIANYENVRVESLFFHLFYHLRFKVTGLNFPSISHLIVAMQIYYMFLYLLQAQVFYTVYVDVDSVIQLIFNSHFRCADGAFACAANVLSEPIATDWKMTEAS